MVLRSLTFVYCSMTKVGNGEYVVETGDDVLETENIWTCIASTFYDEEADVRGLAHAITPGSEEPGTVYRVFGGAVDEMLEEGANTENIEAYLVGGSRGRNSTSVGINNLSMAKEFLDDKEIEWVEKDVGGNYVRSVKLDYNGNVSVDSEQRDVEDTFDTRSNF